MKRSHILLVLGLLVLSCMLAFLVREHFSEPNAKPVVTYYFRISDDLDYKAPSQDLMNVMDEMATVANLKKADAYFKTNFLLYETLNFVDQIMLATKYPKDIKYIYGLRGSDMMASKSNLAMVLRTKYPDSHIDMIPNTFILENNIDIAKLLKEYNANYVYITKKNVQRQEGNVLTRDLESMIAHSEDTVVAQEVLMNPYLVNDRKINLRVYMLIMIDEKNNPKFFMYGNGFIYYTPKEWAYGTNPDTVITTGYIDRDVYVANPMTFDELEVYMDRKGDNYKTLMNNTIQLMTRITEAYTPILVEMNKTIPGIKFLVYGCDIAPDTSLKVKIMEINKGPDLSYKDERDMKVKKLMMEEVFEIVGLVPRKRSLFYPLN